VVLDHAVVRPARGRYAPGVLSDEGGHAAPNTRADLVRRAQSGDHDAFEVLVRGAIPRLYAVALRILRDLHQAEDAVQDTLVDAWRDVRALRDPDLFESWATSILVRNCYRAAKRARAARQLPPATPATGDNPMAAIDDRERIERAFRRLTPDHRVVIVLRHYLDWEPAEIAAVLGLAPGTVRSRLHYAIASMRAELEADERTTAPPIPEPGR
jgi:RNA polymerase sigma-70 factor (ECF subfamily)